MNWTAWLLVVSEQTCSSGHKTDKSFCQTLGSFDVLHSSQKWFPTHCHLGNTAQHCIGGQSQDSDFAGGLEGPKSSSRGVLCFLGSRTFLSVSWMCKKQKFCLAQLHGVWDHCSRCWIPYGWVTCSTNNNVQSKQTSTQETGAVLDSKTKIQHVKRR